MYKNKTVKSNVFAYTENSTSGHSNNVEVGVSEM